MASVAGCWQGGVVVVHVAACARHGDVSASQRKCSSAVIESCCRPNRRIVAGGTGGWKSGNRMGRACGSVVICLMAAVACSRQRGVVVIHVAACAGDCEMSTG